MRGGWGWSGRGWLGGGRSRGFFATGECEGERGEGGERGFHGRRQGGSGGETRGACRIFNWMGSELRVEGHGEDFHGVEGFGGVWEGAEVETDLGETADVAHGDEVGGGGRDVVGLQGAEGGGGFGFVDVVGAGAAAAGIAVGDFAESDVRDLAEEGARGAADALGVAEVAGVVVGDAERAGWGWDGREAETEEEGGDVFDFGGEGGGGGFFRAAFEDERVFVEAGAAAGGIGEDGVDVVWEGLEIAASGGAGIVTCADVPCEGTAAALGFGDDDLDA